MLDFFEHYKCARGGFRPKQWPSNIPWNGKTRMSILAAFWDAFTLTLRQLKYNLFKRRKAMQDYERRLMAMELPPRLIPGRRMISDSVTVEGKDNGNTV